MNTDSEKTVNGRKQRKQRDEAGAACTLHSQSCYGGWKECTPNSMKPGEGGPRRAKGQVYPGGSGRVVSKSVEIARFGPPWPAFAHLRPHQFFSKEAMKSRSEKTRSKRLPAKHEASGDVMPSDRGQTGVMKNNDTFLKLLGRFPPLKPRISPAMSSHLDREAPGRANNLSWKLVREVGKMLLLKHLGSSFFMHRLPKYKVQGNGAQEQLETAVNSEACGNFARCCGWSRCGGHSRAPALDA